jgi:hypothetical protein
MLRDVFVTNGGYGVKAHQSAGENAIALVGQSMFTDDFGGRGRSGWQLSSHTAK